MDLGGCLPGTQDPASAFSGKCHPGVAMTAEKQRDAGSGAVTLSQVNSMAAADTYGSQGMKIVTNSLLTLSCSSYFPRP